jgi:hypothetical protein
MKRHLLVKVSDLLKLPACFSDADEWKDFIAQVAGLISEMNYIDNLAIRNQNDEDYIYLLALKQLFILTLFYRDNIEAIQAMTKTLKFLEISEEQHKKHGDGIGDIRDML